MTLFGGARDIILFGHINRELINNIIQQSVGYYKIALDKTSSNLYGESLTKTYNDPILVNCLIERTSQEWTESDLGADVTRSINVRFFRDILVGKSLYPEVGDVMLWNENYYEISGIVENQLVVGKDPSYAYDDTGNFGSSLSIIVDAQYVRPEKLGLKQERL